MGFNHIFWGIFLSFFDFRLQGLDILPDFIGFILIYNGVNKLYTMSGHFKTAKKFAIPLILLSIFDLYQPQQVNGIETNVSILSFLYGLAEVILIIQLFYFICKGIKEKSIELGYYDLASQSMNRWKALLVFECLYLIVPPIAKFNMSLAGILFIIVFVFAIGILVLLMSLMKMAKNQLPNLSL